MANNPLFDTIFLQKLDADNNKETYVRIIATDHQGNPKEQIEGMVQSGNLNIDGSSAIRRSCNLTLKVLPNTTFTSVYWGLENQFKLEIGIKNNVDFTYPPIIWFKQGSYVINGFSKSQTTTDLTINISGQDKMCLLNGTIGGALPEQINFGTIDTYQDDGTKIENNIPLFTIIQKSLIEYGNERLDKIIINDLDYQGLELLEYQGEKPLYLIYEPISSEDTFSTGGVFRGITIDSTTPVWLSSSENTQISEIKNYYQLNALDTSINNNATKVAYSPKTEKNCVVVKINYGQTIGYRVIDLVYAGDLIENTGSPLTSVFDKIKTQLGEYEYFYDINGNFVFQKKRTYISELFSPINGDIIEPQMVISPYSYSFTDLSRITNISYSPDIKNLKNDFTIWGERQGINGKIPVHVRYAIDKKPNSYYDYEGKIFYYTTAFKGSRPLTAKSIKCDWREVIYQMALDYNKHNEKIDYFRIIKQHNSFIKDDGKTGYENYYASMLSFWRQLYYIGINTSELPIGYTPDDYYTKGETYEYWYKGVYTQPDILNFWFDFLDIGDGNLLKLNKQNCGARQKTNTSKKTATIFQNNTPEILFYTNKTDIKNTNFARTYTSIWIPESVEKLFSVSSQNPSLISQINDLIYQHCCCHETITFTTLPIYYLEPNTRIYVEGIGDLILNKISYALGHNATMSLSCTKVVDSIY